MRAILAALVFALAAEPAAARTRAQTHWGGPDLSISCETVRSYRPQIDGMSRATRAALARQFGITRKQRRQALDCLRDR